MSEPRLNGTHELSARAGVAMLSLQLRNAHREAEQAELAAAELNHSDALAELRGRLEPLFAQRQAELSAELAAQHLEAAALVAAAQEQAARIVEAAEHEVAERDVVERESAGQEADERWATVELYDEESEHAELALGAEPAVHVDPPIDLDGPPSADTVPSLELPVADATAVQVPPPLPPPVPVAPPAVPTSLTIDAEGFARVFATVMATMMDQRGVQAAEPPAREKSSFWRHARHVDVLLLGVATVLVLVVFAAWLV